MKSGIKKGIVRGAALGVFACICLVNIGITKEVKAEYTVNMSMQKDAKDGEYNRFFLKDDLQTISIDVDENELKYLYENAIDKACVETNSVTIGDETIGHVGLKTKGSYTLEHSVTDNKGSHRYSFTLNFGKYVKKEDYGVTQNFYGVKKISLNNFFFDKSMLKEYCAWTLLSEMGLPTSQFGLTKLYINGEYFGVYFMVESLDSSILEQYFNCNKKDISDYLCKPENTKFDYEELLADPSVLWENDEDTYAKVQDMIPTVLSWAEKLNQLSDGLDFEGKEIDVNSEEYVKLLEEVLDVDEVVKYFAVHSFLVQTDNMFMNAKNFGLYVDENAKGMIIPWDYDLSFGCYSPGDSESTANYDIDLMYTTWGQGNPTKEQMAKYYSNFPLFNVIYQNDSLREQMHAYMKDCSKIMTLGGTTSLGKTYTPAYMAGLLKAIKAPLEEAASEKVFVEARYMNHISQPKGVTEAFNNLTKIIAMRSVGVYTQVQGIDTYVSGKGANNETLGNGMQSWWNKDSGNLTAVDATTGIFVSAVYSGVVPQISVQKLTDKDGAYKTLTEEFGKDAVIYKFTKTPTAKGKYTVTVPTLALTEREQNNVKLYAYINGQIQELDYTREDNLLTASMDKLDYIIVVQNNPFPWGLVIAGGIAFLALIAGGIILVAVKKKRSQRQEEE